MLRSAYLLALVAILGTTLLAVVHALTRDRIAAQERRVVLQQLNQVLREGTYDNALHEDVIDIHDPAFFKHAEAVRVYRARKQGRPVAVVFNLVTADGYNGDIRLLVAIRTDGRVGGVRVIAHRETPGLGDPIELARSNWVLGFDGHSLVDPDTDRWAVRRDGGIFDQFTGATITPRAVVEAVQRALEYFALNREALFEATRAGPDYD